MAKMVFVVSEQEFKENVNRIYGQLPGMSQEPIGTVVDFFQEFMIDMETEKKLGHYDYELQVGNRSIPLDSPDSEAELSKLVTKVFVF